MHKTSTFKKNLLQKSLSFSLIFLGLLTCQFVLAHNVTGYTPSCATGPKYSVDPKVNSVNSKSNYAWQYRNSSGNWVCIVNGNNTIKGNTYSISGASSVGTDPAPIVFSNPNNGLDELVIRCIIADGTNVNPCSTSATVYNAGSNAVTFTIDVTNTPCATNVMTLGNRVWYDKDNTGINNDEDGIAGVTVYLYKAANNTTISGAAIASDVTDANGFYYFPNLYPGDYIVGVVTPAGYMSSSKNGGDPDNNINYDNNGVVTVGNETRGYAITLTLNGEPDGNSNVSYDFGFLPDCSCVTSSSNLLKNGSFEEGTKYWTWDANKTNFTTGTGYVACGTYNAFNDWKTGTSIVYQSVDVTPGNNLVFKGFAGTHTEGISYKPKIRLVFYNGTTELSTAYEVVVDQDVDKNHNQLKQYTITATVPATATKVQVQSVITYDFMKLDAFCLTSNCVTPAAPTATVTQPTCSNATGSVALSNLPSVGTWTVTYTYNNTSYSFTGSGTTYTKSGLSSGTYVFKVTNAGGCVSDGTSVIVNAQPVTPSAPKAVVSQSICGTASTATVTLSGLPSSGNWTINQTGTSSATISGSGTTATISGLAAGTYNFSVTANGCTSSATSISTAASSATLALGGFVWEDVNKNGIDDDGSRALANVLVSLYKDANADGTADGSAINTFTTTSTGRYSFTKLCPGSYLIGFGSLNGYVRTLQLNKVNGDASDSDPSAINGLTGTITLVDKSDYTNDAGYYSATILPVDFGSIVAKGRNCEVALSFEVLTQKNTKQFEIQSSKDGGKWDNIGVVSAKASSTAAYTYNFTHTQPAVGVNLYRIKVVDTDGKVSYSEVASATSVCSGKAQITTYPNPAFEMLNVSLPAIYQDAQVQLFNGMGQMVVSNNKQSGLVRSLNTQNLTPGIYLLKVTYNNNVVMTQKVVKGE